MADFEDRVSDEEKVRGAPLSLSLTSARARDQGPGPAAVGSPGGRSRSALLASACRGRDALLLRVFPPGAPVAPVPHFSTLFLPGLRHSPLAFPAGKETFPYGVVAMNSFLCD